MYIFSFLGDSQQQCNQLIAQHNLTQTGQYHLKRIIQPLQVEIPIITWELRLYDISYKC